MNSKATSIKSAIADFMRKHGISGEMEQSLVKEAIHLHLLSALSDVGVLGHVVFQGGTALRLCYGGERYSRDLDFVCVKAGSYIAKIEFAPPFRTPPQITPHPSPPHFPPAPSQYPPHHPP